MVQIYGWTLRKSERIRRRLGLPPPDPKAVAIAEEMGRAAAESIARTYAAMMTKEGSDV